MWHVYRLDSCHERGKTTRGTAHRQISIPHIIITFLCWSFEHSDIDRWLVVLNQQVLSCPGRDKFVCPWCRPSVCVLHWWGSTRRNSPAISSSTFSSFFFFFFNIILKMLFEPVIIIFPPPMHVLNGSLRTFLSASQATAVRQYSKASCPLMSLFRCSSESFDITTQIDHRACKCYVTAQQPT